jgi:hypothetical protein
VWRRLDSPGHESCRLFGGPDGFRLDGTAVFVHDGLACRLDYDIACDPGWRTTAALVRGWVGETNVAIDVAVDDAPEREGSIRRWRQGGAEVSAVAGCLDIDLNFSPATNLLPIRRAALAPGEQVAVTAAWLRFPSFGLEPLPQIYRRLDATTYRYESAGGKFVRELRVDERGFVVLYPGLWEQEAGG